MGKLRFALSNLSLVVVTFAMVGCNKLKDVQTAIDKYNTDVYIKTQSCVQVYYDQSTDSSYKMGRDYAIMTLNLLGHFPEFQQIVGPIEKYKKGDLDKCAASIYLGSYFENSIPQAFLDDYKTTKSNVVWIGYSYWKLGTDFENLFGYKYNSLTTLDKTNLTSDGKPTFFRDVIYKGETFTKYNEWNSDKSQFLSAFEQSKLEVVDSSKSTVLAESQHSLTGEKIPWAIRAGNRFYISEIPLSYIHESDRYLVFADLLFDILNAVPKHNNKYAIIRMEDIHPMSDLTDLNSAVDIMNKYNVTPHISLVPIFRDPFFEIERTDTRVEIPMEDVPNFFNSMKQLKSDGAVFVWHGATHQHNNDKNPWTGMSTDDFEFWDAITNKPVAEDSVGYVLERLDKGFDSLVKAGIEPKVWLTPHYQASPLDNIIFGQVFPWTIGRGIYFDHSVTGLQQVARSLEGKADLSGFFYRSSNSNGSNNRKTLFGDLKVDIAPGADWVGQIFPYEIYSDFHGAKVIPENLGNVQPGLNVQVTHTRYVETILADAKRNKVLRDTWASVFYHPFLLNPNNNPANGVVGQPKDLEVLIKGLQDLGYKFISLDSYIDSNKTQKSPPRVEL